MEENIQLYCAANLKSSVSRYSLHFVYFDVIIRQRLTINSRYVSFFFSRANEIKPCGLVQQIMLGMLSDLILQSRDFQSLKHICLKI